MHTMRPLAHLLTRRAPGSCDDARSCAAANASPVSDNIRELLRFAAGERPGDKQQVHYHYELHHGHAHGHQHAQHAHAEPASAREAIASCASRLTYGLVPGTPRSVEGALQPSAQARVVVELEHPYRVIHVNDAFERMVGAPRRARRPALRRRNLKAPASWPVVLRCSPCTRG